MAEQQFPQGLTPLGSGGAATIDGQLPMQLDSSSMTGESLDEMLLPSDKEMQMPQSMPQSMPQTYSLQDEAGQSTLMDFGGPVDTLQSFQFGLPTPTVPAQVRRLSSTDVDMNTGYMDVSSGMDITSQSSSFAPPLQPSDQLAMAASGYQMPSGMAQSMFPYTPLPLEEIPEDRPMSMYPTQFPFPPGNVDPMRADYIMSSHNLPVTQGDLTAGDGMDTMMMRRPLPNITISGGEMLDSSVNLNTANNMGGPLSPMSTNSPYQDSVRALSTPSTSVSAVQASQISDNVKMEESPTSQNVPPLHKFDVTEALNRVNMRKDPEIDIAPVDISCAFVVCDATARDCPIIYASEVFERLTGYKREEIRGRNCRFLQSPKGKVEAGVKRLYSDDKDVRYLKSRISAKKEAQRGLINYRKGGQPFINLLTVIPITWGTEEIRYYVGFQLDLLDQPAAVTDVTNSGAYAVNYSQAFLREYTLRPPESYSKIDTGPPLSGPQVSMVLNSLANGGESKLAKHLRDQSLLQNTDHVTHILSPEGVFLYVSPSCKQVLEYDPAELVGRTLSSVCHPGDIVSVTRELNDLDEESTVEIVYRIRRKKSGYIWFESYGSLGLEPQQEQKHILMAGRERPVFALTQSDIDNAGGIGENEMWTKLSTTGMFLFVSSNIRTLLDRQPDELIGTSIQALMRPDSKLSFGRALKRARAGNIITHKHDIHNKRGLVLQAQTTLYPGDTGRGQKPTFLVAQTRLLKASSRNAGSSLSTAQEGGKLASTWKIDPQSQGSSPNIHFSSPSQTKSDQDTPSPIMATGLSQTGGLKSSQESRYAALMSDACLFSELKTTRGTSWQFEVQQMERNNRILAEELAGLISNKKKRKRRKGGGNINRQCSNCHTMSTPEWRRGPTGQRDLCNSCGLRFAKQVSTDSSNRTIIEKQATL